ncbi:MAG: hypothetical protein HXY44_11950 [Syntrophaceae bacterium]|nr:hypothetical protein [Syntrophaceae bacterium]
MDVTNLIPRVPDFPALTIRKSGHISIHQLTVDRFGLMGTKYVNLDFDPVETTLEIKPSIDESEAPYKVSKERSGALIIQAKEFLDCTGVVYSHGSRVFPVRWNRLKGRIVAQLKQ